MILIWLFRYRPMPAVAMGTELLSSFQPQFVGGIAWECNLKEGR